MLTPVANVTVVGGGGGGPGGGLGISARQRKSTSAVKTMAPMMIQHVDHGLEFVAAKMTRPVDQVIPFLTSLPLHLHHIRSLSS